MTSRDTLIVVAIVIVWIIVLVLLNRVFWRRGKTSRAKTKIDAGERLRAKSKNGLNPQRIPKTVVAPSAGIALNNRGLGYYIKKDFANAIATFNSAIDAGHADAALYNNRGLSYHALGERERALADFASALSVDHTFVIALANRGAVFHSAADFENAIFDLDSAIDISPDFAPAYNNRGCCYFAQDDIERAYADFDKAAEINRQYDTAQANRFLIIQAIQNKRKIGFVPSEISVESRPTVSLIPAAENPGDEYTSTTASKLGETQWNNKKTRLEH